MHRILTGTLVLILGGCSSPAPDPTSAARPEGRVFSTSFESLTDFDGMFYKTQPTVGQDSATDFVHSGKRSHKTWLLDTNAPSTATVNNNHRGYPAIQLWRLPGGSFRTPVRATIWVRLEGALRSRTPLEDDWVSLATFTCDSTDNWARSVLVNVDWQGRLHLMHVPVNGQKVQNLADSSHRVTFGRWTKIETRLVFGQAGSVQVWQDDTLVSSARVDGCTERLAQAHFGMYSPPWMKSFTLWNDDLTIREE